MRTFKNPYQYLMFIGVKIFVDETHTHTHMRHLSLTTESARAIIRIYKSSLNREDLMFVMVVQRKPFSLQKLWAVDSSWNGMAWDVKVQININMHDNSSRQHYVSFDLSWQNKYLRKRKCRGLTEIHNIRLTGVIKSVAMKTKLDQYANAVWRKQSMGTTKEWARPVLDENNNSYWNFYSCATCTSEREIDEQHIIVTRMCIFFLTLFSHFFHSCVPHKSSSTICIVIKRN